MKKIYLALVMLLSLGSTLWIEKVSAGPVHVIRNNSDWIAFRDAVANAKGQYRVDARLEADFSTSAGIGVGEDTPYCGIFDGNGHTITATNIWRNDGKPCALFCYAKDATIKNLHLKGSITGNIHSAGLIGKVIGSPTVTISRVWVSTEVNANGTHAGGIIGHSDYARVYMTDCRFDGKVNTNNSNDSYAGDIIGWCNGGSWNLQRVYDQGSPKAYYMYYCIDYNSAGGSWKTWGTNNKSFTVTHHNWNTCNYYNKSDQAEVVKIMNGFKADTWELVDGKAVPKKKTNQNSSAFQTEGWTFLEENHSSGYTLQSGRYYVNDDVMFENGATGSGLTISSGATVYIYIPKGVTLTAQGGDASGQTGAGAGIHLPQSSTLYLLGEGELRAYGGHAADGCNGSQGQGGSWTGSISGNYGGNGGTGGAGGGGAGAGIGTCGANGGNGGSGGRTPVYSCKTGAGVPGEPGSSGGTALPMGTLIVAKEFGNLHAVGGDAGSYGGSGGPKANDGFYHQTGTYNYSMAGGGGGGGGGFGGGAKDIGTGGPGGGGGGSGSGGSTDWDYKEFRKAGSHGGKGGQNANGSWANTGTGSDLDDPYAAENHNDLKGASYDNDGWRDGKEDKWRKPGGNGGGVGGSSTEKLANIEYFVTCSLVKSFDGNDKPESVTTGFLANEGSLHIGFNIPTCQELGLTKPTQYLSRWNTQRDGKGSWYKAKDQCSIGKGTLYLYAAWEDYKDIFPKGSGTKGDPFIIEDGLLLQLADYVNNGHPTRGLYFKQRGNIKMKDVLSNNHRDSKWVPIGHTYIFEGDYDGGGKVIYDGEITDKYDICGIFGKVAGSIHNLGVKDIKLIYGGNQWYTRSNRYGAIAGLLCADDKKEISGQMHDCFAANCNVQAGAYGTAGALVGELSDAATMTHCHSYKNTISGDYIGHISGRIWDNAKVDFCFTTGDKISGNDDKATNCQTKVSETKMSSGELTWLLNDKTAFAGAWRQDVDNEVTHNAYPVLDSISAPVYYNGSNYTNQPSGTIFKKLTGEGTSIKPFLINTISDLEFIGKYCREGNNSSGIHFLQTADFDLSGKTWKPIGDGNAFAGYYDGGGHTIRNALIEADGMAGLFGIVKGTVTRLCMEKSTIKYMKRDGRSGGIAARLTGDGEISNCLVYKCTVMHNGSTGNSQASKDSRIGVAGGIASDMFDNAVIKNCLVYRTTVSATRTGQISSDTKSGNRIHRCFTDGGSLVSSDSYAKITDSKPALDDGSLGSGEIAFELNDTSTVNPNPVWFQNITKGSVLDSVPVLTTSGHGMVFKKRNGNFTNDGVDLARLGDGTPAKPFLIGKPEDLQDLVLYIGTRQLSNFYVLQTADIDMMDKQMLPIGSGTNGFEGHYDGNGYVIRNVEFNKDQLLLVNDESLGLFNNIIGTVERLGIENSTFTAIGRINRVGALAGRLSGSGKLLNCFAKGCTIDFNSIPEVVVGALVGEQTDDSRIETSYGYKNTVIGQEDVQKRYGYIVGNIGSNAQADLVFTDGPSLSAENQSGAKNIVHSGRNIAESCFMNGEVCWLISGSRDNSPVWRQTIRTDGWPVPNPSHKPVYRRTNAYQVQYINTNEYPYQVLLTLDPNYSGGPSVKQFEIYKADERYYVPSFSIKPYPLERSGYDFTGWNTQKDRKGTFYPADAEVLPTGNSLTLYAMWDFKLPANMPADGKAKVEILEQEASYRVYDDGGSQNPYSPNCNGKVTLKAPAGCLLRLSGTVATEAPGSDGNPRDYMTVYDGDYTKTKKLTNEKGESVFFSKINNGEKYDIGKLISSDNEMTIEFVSNAENCYQGLDLLVTVLPPAITNLEGKGTKEEPFLVASVDDLNAVDQYIRMTGDSKIYVQQCDSIDMEGALFTPIAASIQSFNGHYDGCGYIIRNGKIQSTAQNLAAGIFPVVTGTVTRLGVENMTVEGVNDNARIGAIAGRLNGNGEITNCYVKNCTVTSNVASVAGAVVADMFDRAAVKNCLALNNTLKASRTGAICSDMTKDATLNRCYTDANALVSSEGKGAQIDCETGVNNFRLASGEICYLLNSTYSDSIIWRQTIGTGNQPILYESAPIVYGINNQYTNDNTHSLLDLKLLYQVKGEKKVINVLKGSLIKLDKYTPQDVHFPFKEWSTKVDGSGTVYPKDATMLYNEELTLYAQYDNSINMPKEYYGIIWQHIPDGFTSVKVYDDGGKDAPYSKGGRYVTLFAPEGCRLQLTGSVTTKEGWFVYIDDYLIAYDCPYSDDLPNDKRLRNQSDEVRFYSRVKGNPYDIGTLTSSGSVMTLYFKTSSNNDGYKGLDLTVKVLKPQYEINSRENLLAVNNKIGDIRLNQDIDLGVWDGNFTLKGNFDGGGHTITYTGKTACWGLFKNINYGASVKHLQVKADVVTTKACGGIAYINYGTISDCHFNGTIRKFGLDDNARYAYQNSIAGIAVHMEGSGLVDHCSATGSLILMDKSMGKVYPISNKEEAAVNYWTWVDPTDLTLYAAQADSAKNVKADYPVYAKGILDVVESKMAVGTNIISVVGGHLSSLTITDGQTLICPAEVSVDNITYKRRGTNNAYEPWVLPFDYTIDASMFQGGVEFYRFEKDVTGNILMKQITSADTYQVVANEPLAFRAPNESEYNFAMKLVKDGHTKPMTIKIPKDGVAASMASTKDIARIMVNYGFIAADKAKKELMYIWNNDKDDFVLSDGKTGVGPFRYYLQYADKATGNLEEYAQTDWARKQRKKGGAAQQAIAQRRAAHRGAFSELIEQGWQPIVLEPAPDQVVTAEMLADYDILFLSDIYDEAADDRFAVTVIYEPAEEGMAIPFAAPLLVRAKHEGATPLVTPDMAEKLEEALTKVSDNDAEEIFEEMHYWCSTFSGRYDVWQMPLPESDNLLNEYGALIFGESANSSYFYRVGATGGVSMQPMSYCFTAYDATTFENLPLTNDRIGIIVYDRSKDEPTGVEDVTDKTDDVRGKTEGVYNLQGQKVDDSYRGIIIKNGRKIFKR